MSTHCLEIAFNQAVSAGATGTATTTGTAAATGTATATGSTSTPARGYRIYVGTGLLAGLGSQLAKPTKGSHACIISDSNVAPLYLKTVRSSMEQAGFTVCEAVIPAGEQSKSFEQAQTLWEELAAQGMGRDGVVVALGGGVVGDLAAFVASTYMRGVSCVQIPTSLLAMVDSSIGGKTAVNIPAGKNLVGTFAQPVLVAIDLDTLNTLPSEEWDNGYAEIAKSALVEGGSFFEWLAKNVAALRAQDTKTVQEAIIRSLTFKGRVVAADEKETGERLCLNYGHTFAHALEAVAGYGTISHGRAVAEGMRFAAALAPEALEACQDPKAPQPSSQTEALKTFQATQNTLLDALGLSELKESYPVDELFGRMLNDKKNRAGELNFVFVTSPGNWQAVAVDPDLVKIHLILWAQSRLEL
ncbi:MAG: 3-dehydroquinate synthase [Coriobacteriia bacterium]|nr:3-dehydroquinate synthase [Coriobacteriia bacterium]